MREHPEPRPRDHTDAAEDLADIASHFAAFKGEANAYLRDLSYNTLRLTLENARAAVEAAAEEAGRRVWLSEG